ncbi:MAG: hypothetical protein IPN77_33560 [Sandaracinaceae bacterium]|nr:hypothetical protein [Sandaracinaceae bacterium]
MGALVGTPEQARKQKQVGDIIIASGTGGGHTGEVAAWCSYAAASGRVVAPTLVLTAGGVGTGLQARRRVSPRRAGRVTGSIWLTTNESEEAESLIEKLQLAATSSGHAALRAA